MCRGRRNHVLSWLVAPAVLACTPLVARGADAFIRGDANGDSEVDLSDPVTVLLNLFVTGGGTFPCDDAADANDDGEVGLADATFTLSYLFRLGAPPPPPTTDCGPDPTPDPLTCKASACAPSRTGTVGPEGGSLVFPNGIELLVPEGAVSEVTEFSVSAPPPEVHEVIAARGFPSLPRTVVAGLRVEPDGTTFSVPITVVAPLERPLPLESFPMRAEVDLESRRYRLAETDLVYSSDEGRIVATVEHFSNVVFVDVSGLPPDAPCRSGRIHVHTGALDFSGGEAGGCTIVSDFLEITFLDCPGQPTERVSVSELSEESEGDCTFTIEVVPDPISLAVCQEASANSIVRDQDGRVVAMPVFWQIGDAGVATIAFASGELTGRSEGTTVALARTPDPNLVGEATVVVSGEPSEISIERVEVAVGDGAEPLFQVFDDEGTPLTGLSLRWESVDPDIASIGSTTGRVRGQRRGQTKIRACCDLTGVCGEGEVEVVTSLEGTWDWREEVLVNVSDGAQLWDCVYTGTGRIEQDGLQVDGRFEGSASCTVTVTLTGETFDITESEQGKVRTGTISGSALIFSERDDSDLSETCTHRTEIAEDRPARMEGTILCREVDDNDELISKTTGTWTATRR